MLRLLRRLRRSLAAKRRAPRVAHPPLDSRIPAWLASWGALWSVPDLPSRVRIVYSARLTRALGRCTPRAGSIRLNPGLAEAPVEVLREVVCHEAAHAAAFVLHGRSARPHGREWKALMHAAGYEPRVRWGAAEVPEGVRRRA